MVSKRSRTTVLAVTGCALALAAVGGTGYAAGQITGSQIKDKTLGPNDLLVRVASKAVDNDAIPAGTAGTFPALKVTITAPTKGYLVATASTDAFDYAAEVDAFCFLRLGSKYVLGTNREIAFNGNGNPGDDPEQDCVTNATIPVKAGKKTVSFVGSVGATTTFDESALQVEFVPFNGQGKRPTAGQIAGALGRSLPRAVAQNR
ncbi:MAG TPA: hypothetical protein PLP61_15625 [Nocardioides sp.]|uniref:hypothetical protein n=1 Tax=Nocardioides sp. TaxID=35761 RepID=UPI002C30DF90|nr:hypothetical protein [Nocardioides sp.]HQR28473.1 hypothetical protein [Nocardioides sp.]